MLKMLAAVGTGVVAVALLTAVPVGAARGSPHVQQVGITIRAGDTVTEPNIALAPGVPVRITVTNYTHEFHTFTVPGLGISKLILPSHGHLAHKTTFTFTAQRWGSFAWHCLICPTGMHGPPHSMSGTLYLLINPSALP